jgi:multidrug efflux pump subunit AcrA (membrane-fusion protein)
LTIAGAMALACLTFSLTGCGHPANAAAAAPAAPVVPVVPVTRDTLSSDLVLSAEFIPDQDVDVMAKVAGYVKNIPCRHRRSRAAG